MALTNAERQRLYIARLRARAGAAPTKPTSTLRGIKTSAAQAKAAAKKAWKQARGERRAYREAALGWRHRLDAILRSAAGIASPQSPDAIAKEARELFGIKWKHD